MIAITNINIVLHTHLLFNATLLLDGGVIADFARADKLRIPEGSVIIDGNDDYIGPGLIDIHTHAGGSHNFDSEPIEAAQVHLASGTTSVFPALYFSFTQREYIDAIRLLKSAGSTDAGRIIRGAYLEGPYLNPSYGADQENVKWADGIEPSEYLPILEEAAGFAKVVCISPERSGIERFVRDVSALLPDAVLSVAHSEASPQQIESLIPFGLRLSTHHTNATGTRVVYPECRGVCVDEAVNMNDEIYAELICDEVGIHVDPYMLRLVRKIKGNDRIILISDACVFDAPAPPGYEGVTDINFDDAGQIAGSKLTLSKACKNMMQHTGASICDVFNFASYNPAKLLGMKGRGEIARGAVADLIITDHKMNVRRVFLAGVEC